MRGTYSRVMHALSLGFAKLRDDSRATITMITATGATIIFGFAALAVMSYRGSLRTGRCRVSPTRPHIPQRLPTAKMAETSRQRKFRLKP